MVDIRAYSFKKGGLWRWEVVEGLDMPEALHAHSTAALPVASMR